MVWTSKKLAAENGISSSPTVRPCKVLPPATAKMVNQFYMFDEISKIRSCGWQKIMFLLAQKAWIILCNLKDAHFSPKKQHSEKLLCFSKFAESQPKHCVLAAVCGMHAVVCMCVCTCTIHQNVELKISGAKLYDLIEKQEETYMGSVPHIQ